MFANRPWKETAAFNILGGNPFTYFCARDSSHAFGACTERRNSDANRNCHSNTAFPHTNSFSHYYSQLTGRGEERGRSGNTLSGGDCYAFSHTNFYICFIKQYWRNTHHRTFCQPRLYYTGRKPYASMEDCGCWVYRKRFCFRNHRP